MFEVDAQESSDLLSFTIPKELSDGFINNRKEDYKFKFEKIFDPESRQDDVFQAVAEPVIDNVLSGYNGTIFAYGQTGSGKTFTITGGPENFNDRGIIPRTLSYIYESFQKKAEYSYTVHVSYLELYNENGYDLLNPQHQASKLEDLPKVSLMEDEDSNIHLKNLSVHQANNEEEALNLLFLGDTNRMIAETPMNQASTRSHCIFSIHITARETGSATIKRAKLHLVDLAGSERISKSGVNGLLLTEAKYINLSLHYLEQVIVALAEKNRMHVPYRNSLMTSVLRDSLGGNCMTSMIATCSVEKKNIEESISTCRFAQRVALIKNDALVNEELDPKLVILRLKKEVDELKNQLQLSAGGAVDTSELIPTEIERLKRIVTDFLEDKEPDAAISVGADMRKINFCFKVLKDYYLEIKSKPVSAPVTSKPPVGANAAQIQLVDSSHYDSKEMKSLKDTLKQRDNEITILVNMLKKEKIKTADLAANPRALQNNSVDPLKRSDSISQFMKPIENRQILHDMSIGKQEAFEIFKRDYSDNASIEEQKKLLKKNYAEAKTMGESINVSRNKINTLKTRIEQMHVRLAATDSLNNDKENNELEALKTNMEKEKENYRENFEKLKQLKGQIEHFQYLIQKSQVKLQKDFENWWNEQCAILEQKQHQQQSSRNNEVGASFRNNTNSSMASSFANGTAASTSYNSLNTSRNSSGTSLHQVPNGTDTVHRYQPLSVNNNNKNDMPKINLTGDNLIDADITAFMNARKKILSQMKPNT